MTINERIAQLRGKESRRSFAERIGIVENTLRNYEQGLSLPNSDVIAEICDKLNVSVEWLIFGQGPMRKGEVETPTLQPLPVNACYTQDIVRDAVEVLEEILQEENKIMSPAVKAEVVCQLCQLIVENEQEKNTSPVKILRLVKGALA